ncbi:MAG: pyridoxamine 5'-phosphate oxidase family protein [Rhodobacter sp.]|nr:pyridoxamine 5'-phosphate oxidase family protein [Paracoccaceae bacterium]MCC0078016.1 pyridoxamine 5'-phosphate oxidase family protein [Rhodobacter sp.]
MGWITTEAELEALYGTPPEAALIKVAQRLTPAYRAWIARSRFCLVATVGPEGTDCSPRGDDGPVVLELDPGTLALPDWRGNNRIDTLRNIVRDGRISLSFLVPGSTTLIRVNGTARLSADPALTGRFEQKGRHPRTVIVVAIAEVYSQCARALIRADLWNRNDAVGLPTVGDFLIELTEGAFDGKGYDAAWGARAAETMW